MSRVPIGLPAPSQRVEKERDEPKNPVSPDSSSLELLFD
jgi:hypothetical protein